MSNEQLYEAALEAIRRLFGDESVSREKTRQGLKALQDEIDLYLDALVEE